MKTTTIQIKQIIESENIVNLLRISSKTNPNLEIQELTFKEAIDIFTEINELLVEGIDKGALDEISYNLRNTILKILQNIQRSINFPDRLIVHIDALQYQIQISGLRKFIVEGNNFEIEFKALTRLRRRYSKLLEDIERAEKIQTELARIDATTKNNIKSIELAKNKVEDYKKLVLSTHTEVERSKIAIIRSEQDIENKKNDIVKFTNEVDLLQNQIESIEKNLKGKIELDIQDKLNQVTDLIEQAETALELKSSEGISAAYSSRLKKLSEEKAPQRWLYGATVFLIVTFFSGYLLTGIQIDIWEFKIGFPNTENISFIFGRILLTAMGISGAAFCANRYVHIKNLEEDYEYKVVLSKSIIAFGNKIKDLDNSKIADYLNKVLSDLHQDPLRDRRSKKEKETDLDTINKLSELIKNWNDLTKN
jgi:hypothetical protein